MKKILLAMATFFTVAANSQTLVVVHNSPDPTAAVVDVWVNVPSLGVNQKVIANFPFRNYFVYSVPTLPPNTAVNVQVKAANSAAADPSLYTKSFSAGIPSGNFVLEATGLLDPSLKNVNANDSFQIAVHPAQLTATAGKVNIAVYNGSPDAAPLTTQSFITTIQSTKRDTLNDNLAFAGSSSYNEYSVGSKRLHVYPTGSTAATLMANGDTLKALNGYAAHIFASGFVDTAGTNGGLPFGLFAVTTNASTSSSTGSGEPMIALPKEKIAGVVQVYHNAADPAVKSVDLYVGGIKQVLGLNFRAGFQSAGFIQDFDYVIDLHQKDSASSILNTTLRFGTDSVVAVVAGVLDTTKFSANPDGVSRKLNFFLNQPARLTAPAGSARVTLFHGATDAETISLTAPALGGLAIATATKYGEFKLADPLGTGVVSTSLGTVVVDVKLPDSSVYKSYLVPLTVFDGKAVTVCTSGFVDSASNQNGASFRVFAGLPSSPFPQILFLKDTSFTSSITNPAIADLSFRMFPNPATTELVLGFDVKEESNVSIEILDLNGKVVKTVLNDVFTAGTVYHTESVRELSNGLYFARVRSGNATSTYKFNIVR